VRSGSAASVSRARPWLGAVASDSVLFAVVSFEARRDLVTNPVLDLRGRRTIQGFFVEDVE
jgi:hypothetical protein